MLTAIGFRLPWQGRLQPVQSGPQPHFGRRTTSQQKNRQQAKETRQSLICDKGCQCARCHQSVAMDQWDFHHTNPNTKQFEINQRVIQGILSKEGLKKGMKIIQKEVSKTLLMCRKCHQLIHKQKKKRFFDKAYWPFLNNAAHTESHRLFEQRKKTAHVA